MASQPEQPVKTSLPAPEAVQQSLTRSDAVARTVGEAGALFLFAPRLMLGHERCRRAGGTARQQEWQKPE